MLIWDNISVDNTVNIFHWLYLYVQDSSNIYDRNIYMGQYYRLWYSWYISLSLAVYTVYVVTEHEGNMNMGQYWYVSQSVAVYTGYVVTEHEGIWIWDNINMFHSL